MISENYNPEKTPRKIIGLKADRTLHRISFVPSTAKGGEILRINIPELNDDTVIVPGSLSLNFQLNIKGHTNNTFVNNLNRNLISQLKISYGGEIISTIQRYDIVKTWDDLFLPTDERKYNFLDYGISSQDIRKLRCGAGDKPSSPDSKEDFLANLHGKNYKINFDHPFLNDHGILFPKGFKNNLLFEIILNDEKNIIVYSDTTKKPDYNLFNIELEYQSINSQDLALKALSTYQIGKSFLYEVISLEKSFFKS